MSERKRANQTLTVPARHLLSIEDLDRAGLEHLLSLTDRFVEVSARTVPKIPALQGKTVVSLFYEDSTRTRLSFETAAKRLSADVMNFSVSTSSANKGESLRDTVETIAAMGIDAIVVRHKAAGVPWQIAGWTDAAVVNGGDGWHQHPTQALLDSYTIRQRLGGLEGRSIAIVGDIKHSRVARSNVQAFTALGSHSRQSSVFFCAKRLFVMYSSHTFLHEYNPGYLKDGSR